MNSGSAPTSDSYTHFDIHYLHFENDVLYCGSDGGVYKSMDNGQTFEDLSMGLSIGQFYSIANTTQDNTVSGGLQDNGSYVRKNEVWRNYTGSDGMASAINPLDSDQIYSMIQFGSLYFSDNGGLSVNALGKPSEAGKWETPMEFDSNGSRVLAGYDQLFEFDFETGWNQLSSFAFPESLSEIAIYEPNSNVTYVSAGHNLFKSVDNGSTYIDVSSSWEENITSIEIDPNNEANIWVTLGGYMDGTKIFSSIDGGMSWINISYNLPNLPTNVVTYDQTTDGIYVGNDVGVYYLAVDSSSWLDFDNNLPNVIVSDIKINPTEEIIQIATFGRGVWQSELYGVNVFSNDVSIEECLYPTNEICGALGQLEFLVKNVGAEAIHEMLIEYTFDNDVSGTYSWEGNLNVGQIALIEINNFEVGTDVNSVLIDLKSPNNVLDEDRSDNEMLVDFITNSTGTIGNFHFQTDCYAAENSWKLFDENELLVAESAAEELINNASIEYEFCLEPGCYTLTVYDTYGDGMAGTESSCDNDGNYYFLLNDNYEFEMGVADFGNSISHSFCVLPNSMLQWNNLPDDMEINCDDDYSTDNTGNASAFTDCEQSAVVIDYVDHISANQLNREWTASDACGTIINHIQTITLIDNDPPVIQCGADISVASQDDDIFVEIDSPTAFDNCGLISIINDFNDNTDASDVYPVGITDVVWIATDISGNIATCMQQVAVASNLVSGIYSNKLDPFDFYIFPNPTDGEEMFLKFNNDQHSIDQISIRDLSGKLILEQRIQQKISSEPVQIYMPNDVSDGLYLVEVQTPSNVYQKKFLIRK